MSPKGHVVMENGERLNVVDVWMERGAIWVKARTSCAKHHFESTDNTKFEVFGRDGTLVRRTHGRIGTDKVTPGDVWTVILDFQQPSLIAELEGEATE